jgi:hypothetical protein
MTVPRSWGNISKQDSTQQFTVAKPQATDGRFKAGGIFLGIAMLVILAWARHALHYYKPHTRGLGSITTAIRHLPSRFPLAVMILSVSVGYTIASSWIFDISIMKYNVPVVYPFALGYGPCLLFLALFNFWGFVNQNEDRQLIKQRIERGRAADATLGIAAKPNWWSKVRGDHHLDDLQRLRNLVNVPPPDSEKGPTAGRRGVPGQEFELQRVTTTATNPFDNTNEARSRSVSRNRSEGQTPSEPGSNGLLSPNAGGERPWLSRTPSNTSMASALTGRTEISQRQPQVVRSMLDV